MDEVEKFVTFYNFKRVDGRDSRMPLNDRKTYREICHCANTAERTYTDLDGTVACRTPGLHAVAIDPRLQICTAWYRKTTRNYIKHKRK